MVRKGKGWHKHRAEHGLAARGIRTKERSGTPYETEEQYFREDPVARREAGIEQYPAARKGYVVVMTPAGKFSARRHSSPLKPGETIVQNAPDKESAMKAAKGFRERRKRALGL